MKKVKDKFKLKIISREGPIYEGEVSSISSYNEKGKFDVLAQHANLISLIKRGLAIRESGKTREKEINFDNALIRVRENFVEVYVGLEGMAPSQMLPST